MSNQTLHIESKGKGYPLVLLHGWGWDRRIWYPLLPSLIEKFEVFLIDLPGFGESPITPQSYKIENLINSLALQTPKKAAWIGWSLGGMLTWHVALTFPEKITHLMTVAASPKFIATEDWPGTPLPIFKKFLASMTQQHQQTLLDFVQLQLRGTENQATLLHSLQENIRTRLTNPLPALNQSALLLEYLDLRTMIHQIQCPSLHLFGGNDVLVPAKVIPLIETLSTGKCEIIKRTGHIPFLTHPDLFLKWLVELVSN